MKQLPKLPVDAHQIRFQMTAGKGLEINRKSTFDGDFDYRFFRYHQGNYDDLGWWDQDASTTHGFAAFNEPHEYVMWFKGLIPGMESRPELTEIEESYGVRLQFRYSFLEHVLFKLIRV